MKGKKNRGQWFKGGGVKSEDSRQVLDLISDVRTVKVLKRRSDARKGKVRHVVLERQDWRFWG